MEKSQFQCIGNTGSIVGLLNYNDCACHESRVYQRSIRIQQRFWSAPPKEVHLPEFKPVYRSLSFAMQISIICHANFSWKYVMKMSHYTSTTFLSPCRITTFVTRPYMLLPKAPFRQKIAPWRRLYTSKARQSNHRRLGIKQAYMLSNTLKPHIETTETSTWWQARVY